MTIIKRLKMVLTLVVKIAIAIFVVFTIIMVLLQLVGLAFENGNFMTGVYKTLFKPLTIISCLTGLMCYLLALLNDTDKKTKEKESGK